VSTKKRPLTAALFLALAGLAVGSLGALVGLAPECAAQEEEADGDAAEAPAPAEAAPKTPFAEKIALARKERQARRYESSVKTIESALALSLSPAEAAELWYEVGQSHFIWGKDLIEARTTDGDSTKELRRARETFEKVVKEYPKEEKAADAAYMIGTSHMLLDELDPAMRAYYTAYTGYPAAKGRARALLRYGVCLAGLGFPDKAAQVYQAVLKEFPEAEADGKKAAKYLQEMRLVGLEAPAIHAKRWLKGIVAEENIRTFRDQVVVVVFFATWCNHCSASMPRLRSLIAKWSDRGVVFLGVANPDDPGNTEPVDAYVARKNIDFLDVALDDIALSWRRYLVSGLPAVAIIDKKGVVRWRGNLAFLPAPMLAKLGEGS
jgi:thiol-disulfide isomerase/thioredoxin